MPSEGKWELHCGDKSYEYDPLAHDGHHEGHTEPLKITTKKWSI